MSVGIHEAQALYDQPYQVPGQFLTYELIFPGGSQEFPFIETQVTALLQNLQWQNFLAAGIQYSEFNVVAHPVLSHPCSIANSEYFPIDPVD
jgi:hypothetical protein